MGRFKRSKMWLGWGPMVLSKEYEIRAVEDDMKLADPSEAPSDTLTFKRMDYYRNQILAMNVALTFAMLNFSLFFYSNVRRRFVITNIRDPVLFGVIFGFVIGIYWLLDYRKRLFKEGRLTVGFRRPKRHVYWIGYYLFLFIIIWVILSSLTYFFGSPGFYLVIFSSIPFLGCGTK